MSITIFIVSGLATWRLAHMVSRENGPLDLFAKLRAHFARKQSRIGGMFDLISCVGCTSVYVGSVTALWAAQDVFGWMMYTLSFSAFATIVERLYRP